MRPTEDQAIRALEAFEQIIRVADLDMLRDAVMTFRAVVDGLRFLLRTRLVLEDDWVAVMQCEDELIEPPHIRTMVSERIRARIRARLMPKPLAVETTPGLPKPSRPKRQLEL